MLNAYSLMDPSDKIYIAGHRGLVGSAIMRLLRARDFDRVITRLRSELDLRDPSAVRSFLEQEKPDVAVLAAARVGGIKANSDAPVEFLIENIEVQNNVICAAYESGVRKLIFLGRRTFRFLKKR